MFNVANYYMHSFLTQVIITRQTGLAVQTLKVYGSFSSVNLLVSIIKSNKAGHVSLIYNFRYIEVPRGST